MMVSLVKEIAGFIDKLVLTNSLSRFASLTGTRKKHARPITKMLASQGEPAKIQGERNV